MSIEGPSFEVQEGEGRARAREGVRVGKRGEGVGGEKIGEARQREDEDARGGEGRAREEGGVDQGGRCVSRDATGGRGGNAVRKTRSKAAVFDEDKQATINIIRVKECKGRGARGRRGGEREGACKRRGAGGEEWGGVVRQREEGTMGGLGRQRGSQCRLLEDDGGGGSDKEGEEVMTTGRWTTDNNDNINNDTTIKQRWQNKTKMPLIAEALPTYHNRRRDDCP